MNAKQLTELFYQIITEYNIQEILDILSKNTSGNLYLVGGFIYRTLALKQQGRNLDTLPDLDFVTDSIHVQNIPSDWVMGRNKYGGMKLKTNLFSIDIDEFKHHININHLKLPYTIDSYFISVPLNIQSIAYDVRNKKLIGEIGINSLNRKLIGVNNLEIFNLEREKRIQKIIDKAKDLNFTPILPKN